MKRTEVWGAVDSGGGDLAVSCLFSLWTPHHRLSCLQLCRASGLLAIPGTAGDVNVSTSALELWHEVKDGFDLV